MAEYYAVLRQGGRRPGPNVAGDAGAAVYDKARNALIGQLKAIDPPLTDRRDFAPAPRARGSDPPGRARDLSRRRRTARRREPATARRRRRRTRASRRARARAGRRRSVAAGRFPPRHPGRGEPRQRRTAPTSARSVPARPQPREATGIRSGSATTAIATGRTSAAAARRAAAPPREPDYDRGERRDRTRAAGSEPPRLAPDYD